MKLGIIVSLIVLVVLVIALIFRRNGQSGDSLSTTNKEAIRYVAIGDSYTIGEGVGVDDSWPKVLTNNLRSRGIDITLIANPSRTGWTAQNAIDRELPVFDSSQPTFATLLIGVNDWVQGVDAPTFRQRLTVLIDRMLATLPKQRLIVVTIPDFSVTATGKSFSNGRDISKGIMEFNAIIRDEAGKRQIPVVDIFELSQGMGTDPTLVNPDGLHPSAKEYRLWEERIIEVAAKLLSS